LQKQKRIRILKRTIFEKTKSHPDPEKNNLCKDKTYILEKSRLVKLDSNIDSRHVTALGEGNTERGE